MSITAPGQDLARGIVESASDERIVLALPGTDYRLHLVPRGGAASMIRQLVGRRVKGTIHADALRLYSASAGGQFIEPVIGEPRIVQGSVLGVDPVGNRLLMDVAVPMWVAVPHDQPVSDIPLGQMINCYVRSATRFALAE